MVNAGLKLPVRKQHMRGHCRYFSPVAEHDSAISLRFWRTPQGLEPFRRRAR